MNESSDMPRATEASAGTVNATRGTGRFTTAPLVRGALEKPVGEGGTGARRTSSFRGLGTDLVGLLGREFVASDLGFELDGVDWTVAKDPPKGSQGVVAV